MSQSLVSSPLHRSTSTPSTPPSLSLCVLGLVGGQCLCSGKWFSLLTSQEEGGRPPAGESLSLQTFCSASATARWQPTDLLWLWNQHVVFCLLLMCLTARTSPEMKETGSVPAKDLWIFWWDYFSCLDLELISCFTWHHSPFVCFLCFNSCRSCCVMVWPAWLCSPVKTHTFTSLQMCW